MEIQHLHPLLNLSSILPGVLLGLLLDKHTPDTKINFRAEYDYIVVGAGSAGSVVASRLSERPCVDVLLLEAGKRAPPLTEIPAFARSFIGSSVDWQFYTTPQKHTGNALNNKKLSWPSGKAVGGSSVINAMLYVRGHKKDYDDWAAQGATGWSYEDVLPYFKKLEENRVPEFDNPKYHGSSGPVTSSRPKYNPELKQALLEAVKELNYPLVDSNGEQQYGFFDFTASTRDSRRCSTGKAYLVPADDRPNLDIVAEAFVTKILIENGRAVGIEVKHRNKVRTVKARREVILSAGTVNSAQLLMLSGIGPKAHLNDMQIPVVADLPVGLNFHDHPGHVMGFTVSNRITPFLAKVISPRNLLDYLLKGEGPLTSTEAISLMAFLTNDGTGSRDTYSDHQIFFLEGVPPVVRTQTNLKKEAYDAYYGPYDNHTTMWCVVELLHPRSRGSITLQSIKAEDPALIEPNYFEDPQDIVDVVEGMKTCQKVMGSNAAKSMLEAGPFETAFPGCEGLMDDNNEFLTCQVKAFVFTTNHQVGTARMGNPTDEKTVVDPQLRVIGIDGLRVVDASVMPIVPSGNTNIPTIMVAEKASDIIKESIDCPGEPDYTLK